MISSRILWMIMTHLRAEAHRTDLVKKHTDEGRLLIWSSSSRLVENNPGRGRPGHPRNDFFENRADLEKSSL